MRALLANQTADFYMASDWLNIAFLTPSLVEMGNVKIK